MLEQSEARGAGAIIGTWCWSNQRHVVLEQSEARGPGAIRSTWSRSNQKHVLLDQSEARGAGAIRSTWSRSNQKHVLLEQSEARGPGAIRSTWSRSNQKHVVLVCQYWFILDSSSTESKLRLSCISTDSVGIDLNEPNDSTECNENMELVLLADPEKY